MRQRSNNHFFPPPPPPLLSQSSEKDLTKLKGYEIEPLDNSEAMINLQEYGIASALFYAMLETAACETSQRVMAMDNATTNAKEMVHGLSLIYNRARQAKITTELAEIIGGVVSGGVQTFLPLLAFVFFFLGQSPILTLSPPLPPTYHPPTHFTGC